MTDTAGAQEHHDLASDLEIVRQYLDQIEPPEELSEAARSVVEAQLRDLMLAKKRECVVK